ncbi:BrnA antitoxin family protein [Occallatibacter riparius]|uniref:BrnA antitoxin family protein n=1 Tax=Occallatibacter riparius TaxID=1002689 RepID=UPI0036F23801
MDVNKVARAIEVDAGHALPGLRESLAQANSGRFQHVHTPEQIVERRRGRRMGRRGELAKEVVTIWLDTDLIAVLHASGDGWQTRVNDTLRASLSLCGKIAPS